MSSLFTRSIALLLFLFLHTPAILQAQNKTLKDAYHDYFPIGVAVTPRNLTDAGESALILKQFNSLTAENAMKMGPIHPEEGRYNWAGADAIVDFAQKNGMKMRGHALCWHQQSPAWMYKDKDGREVSKDVLLQRLTDHIRTVVTRYKGKIYAWDVVNEAISDSPDEVYRNSEFYRICGEEYIRVAFRVAHEADPSAILFYNDYNTENPVKREKIIKLIKTLKAEGIPIHAIGLQGHWSIYSPPAEEIEKSLMLYSELGLPLQITELDMSIYKPESGRREKTAADIDVFTPEAEALQAERYKQIFALFRKHRQHITGVTFWNVSDRHSWLDNFPVRGRKNYPLLFDGELKGKGALRGVVEW